MQSAITFIQAVGFPIFVAVVLLLRVEAMHVEQLKAIHALTQALNVLCAVLGQNIVVAGGKT